MVFRLYSCFFVFTRVFSCLLVFFRVFSSFPFFSSPTPQREDVIAIPFCAGKFQNKQLLFPRVLCIIHHSLNKCSTRMWLSLVERLLWEQDAAGSNPVIRTMQREPPSYGRFSLRFRITASHMRHRASKARYLLWAKTLCAAGGRYSRAFCVQRSIKSRKSASPKILSGTANGWRSRRCRLLRILSSGPNVQNSFMGILDISF